ncbi:hypothetical protein [Streptococcus sobrinus]|uniref:hypothetical protein n=1 Tax=Streptococcus sobrinus TaxID=1310 RepID=UPI0003657A38|nr:hypothetical protein [Streptococcus sobrinus]
METKKSQRMGLVIDKKIEEKIKALEWYRYGPTAIRKKSIAVKDCIELCYDLLIKDNPDSIPFDSRVAELRGQTTPTEKIEQRLKQMQRKQDELLYLGLANFQISQHGSEWDPFDLPSRDSGRDPKQRDLFAQIDELIKEDTAKGQTRKYSH